MTHIDKIKVGRQERSENNKKMQLPQTETKTKTTFPKQRGGNNRVNTVENGINKNT